MSDDTWQDIEDSLPDRMLELIHEQPFVALRQLVRELRVPAQRSVADGHAKCSTVVDAMCRVTSRVHEVVWHSADPIEH